jgi:hypothetical protein
MILILAWRSLRSRPIRTAVLAGGFGLGVAVMAALLGVAAVILEQARAPVQVGGGDVIVGGAAGRLANARFVLTSVLGDGPLKPRVGAASPTERTTLYLVDGNGSTTPVRARGGIPSLERAMHDPETSGVSDWSDTPADHAWAAPDPQDVLLAMDRFHPVPDVPARAASWAEWLYFNGHAGDSGFYLTFLAGPELPSGRRRVGVRLQLDRGGRMTSYSDSAEVDGGELLATAPNLTVGKNHVRLVGREYHITIDLQAEAGLAGARGDLVIGATPGRSLPPLVIRGAAGWVSGYVVPVMSGTLQGAVQVDRDRIGFDGGSGYHDHNWGFWEGVSWQWGQVQNEGLSFVYGRVHPPADAADASRVPAFLMALGPDGPLGYATDVTIDETNRAGTDSPERIVVRGRSESVQLTLDMEIAQTTVTRPRAGSFGAALDFLQLRAQYHVSGRVGDTPFDFRAPGSAETFRGR